MKRVVHIAVREFVATVATRAFIIGLLIMPSIGAIMSIVGPRLFNPRNFRLEGELVIVDPTGLVAPELRPLLDPEAIAARRAEEASKALAHVPGAVRELAASQDRPFQSAMGQIPDLRLIERPATADIEREKAWLNEKPEGPKHLSLVVIHLDAVVPADGKSTYGAYDFYVPPNVDERARGEIQQNLREAIVNARIRARHLDRAAIDAMVRVPRVQSVTVSKDNERQTVRAFNELLPVAVGMLLFIGVMTGADRRSSHRPWKRNRAASSRCCSPRSRQWN